MLPIILWKARVFCCFSGLAFYIHLSLQIVGSFDSFIITPLFFQLPASLRGKLSKGKEKEIWLRNLLTIPFERQLRPQGDFPWLWRWGSRSPKPGKSALGTGLFKRLPCLSFSSDGNKKLLIQRKKN